MTHAAGLKCLIKSRAAWTRLTASAITLGHLRIALGEESALGRCPDDVKVTWLESELNHQFGVPFPDVTLNVWLSFWIDVQVNHHELPTVSFQHLFECLQDGFRP